MTARQSIEPTGRTQWGDFPRRQGNTPVWGRCGDACSLEFRHALAGDAAKGEGVGDGAARARILAKVAARGASGGVEAHDGVAVEVDDLCVGVDLEAAQRVEATRRDRPVDGVERRSQR